MTVALFGGRRPPLQKGAIRLLVVLAFSTLVPKTTLAHGVEFLGRQSDMPAVYRKGSVFVLSSLGEGCCMALLEAMAGGLCPVVTAVGGNLDVVQDGANGLLAPVDDAEPVPPLRDEMPWIVWLTASTVVHPARLG